MKQETNEYEQQAQKFLKDTKTELKITFLKWDYHFTDDKEKRDIYEVVLKRGNREYKFNFGNSLSASGEYILFNGFNERIHLNKNIKGIGNKNIKGFGLLTNGNSKKNKDFKIPSAYDILACLTKNEIGDFNNFCLEYGYNNDSIQAKEIYKRVLDEWNNIKMLYTDEEIEKLGEIN